jgi:leucyl/phenylalanyl-tRNA--protein transferase
MAHSTQTELPFKIVQHPSELPCHTDINRGVPHSDSLYAVGFVIDAQWVYTAYQRGLFPWYSEGEPVLWHSPDPRMVLALDDFKRAPSLHKKLKQWARTTELGYSVTLNRCFERVMNACAHAPRHGQNGTWIHPQLIHAYTELHHQHHAISVEVWHHNDLIAGLYGVLIGKMFFGESMFTTVSDGSKIALACWVRYLQAHGGAWIDCQQVTAHLASLGAKPIPRATYFQHSAQLMRALELDWQELCAQTNLLDAFAQTTGAT